MVTIRRMREEDLDRIMEIENRSFPNPWRRSFFLSDLHRPDAFSIVAENENKVVGYLVAWGGIEVHIANIAVAPEMRNQGIGSRLLKEVFDFAKREGAENIFLEVRVSNIAAQRLYRRFGFEPTYIRKGYYENGEDAIVMEMKVNQAGNG
ncbi:MAG: ribosomal protein S18-alanine N-acetyltransferase [candidate division WOR-3 bacterium]